MAAQTGTKLRVKISTTAGGAGVYSVIAGIRQATMRFQGQNVDVTTLTDADIKRISTIKDATYQLTGFYETDATGQGAIRAAYEAGSEIWIQFLPDGVAGWKQAFTVGTYEIGAAPDGAITVSIDLEGTGAKGVV